MKTETQRQLARLIGRLVGAVLLYLLFRLGSGATVSDAAKVLAALVLYGIAWYALVTL